MPDNQYEIRVATQADISDLVELGRSTFEEAFGADNDPDDLNNYLKVSFNPEVIAQAMFDGSVFYLAQKDNQTVGYLKLNPNAKTSQTESLNALQLERIYVRQSFYGKGLGLDLLSFAIHHATQQNYEYIWLGVWQQNDRAIRFYLKNKFEVIGTKLFKIGSRINEDFVMLRKV